MNTYIYEIDKNLYINLTNYCSNACEFCVRNGKDSYYGNKLWLEKEPTASEVINLIIDVSKYKQIVFCGFGEPTAKIDVLIEIAKNLKARGAYLRINTNGQGSLINGYDITEKLQGLIDYVNVSLNESDRKKYQEICHSVFGEKAFDELLDFAVKCQKKNIKTVLSIVDSIDKEDIEKCKRLAKEKNLTLRVREYISNS